jgi:hypothetical protein
MKVSIGQSVRGITINHDGRLRSFEPHSARLCGRVVAGGTLDLSKLLGMQYTVRRQGLARSNATCSCFQRCHRSRQPIVFPCTQGLAMFAMVLPSISSLRRAQVPGCPDVAFGLPVSKSPGPIRSRANRTWLALPSALRDLQIFYDSITIRAHFDRPETACTAPFCSTARPAANGTFLSPWLPTSSPQPERCRAP